MNTFNKHILGHLTLFFALLLPIVAKADVSEKQDTINNDDVRISLLTCSPHQQIYSLFGHTALHVVDKKRGMDVAVNYGVFSFDKPFFIMRFIFGLTDYEMGVVPYQFFCEEYHYYGCEVTEQEFDLTTEEKSRIMQALAENDKEENRVYRYNYFYDNCTTRARNIVVNNMEGQVKWNTKVPEGTTYRTMVHEKTKGHVWTQFGIDLLLGLGADRPLTVEQYLFLPQQTMDALEKATMTNTPTGTKKLIAKTSTAVEAQEKDAGNSFPLTPLQVCAIFGLVCMVATLLEWKKKIQPWIFDAMLMLAQGVAGLVLTAMIFSEHPTVNLNIQLLLLNPLPLFFGWQALRRYRRGEKHWLWLTECIMFSLFMVLTAFGVQWIDPGVKILACCLTMRYGAHLALGKKE